MREVMCVKDIKQYALFLCKVALEMAESRTFFTTGLKSLRCLLCCHLVYISKADFGCGIVDGRLWEK